MESPAEFGSENYIIEGYQVEPQTISSQEIVYKSFVFRENVWVFYNACITKTGQIHVNRHILKLTDGEPAQIEMCRDCLPSERISGVCINGSFHYITLITTYKPVLIS